jgi:hypothetical protein
MENTVLSTVVCCLLSRIIAKEVRGKVILQPTVSRPVRLGVRHPSGTRDQFFFLLEIFFSQLPVYYFNSALSEERTGL